MSKKAWMHGTARGQVNADVGNNISLFLLEKRLKFLDRLLCMLFSNSFGVCTFGVIFRISSCRYISPDIGLKRTTVWYLVGQDRQATRRCVVTFFL